MNRMYVARLIIVAVALGGVSISAQTQRPRPGPDVRPGINIKQSDLVVTSLVRTGPPVIVNGAVQQPVRVAVKNQGNGPAAIFKVAVEYTEADGGGPFVLAFTVPGEASIWYPSTDAALAAGKSASFSGVLKFHPAARRKRVSLRAIADSCAGDEFMEDYCRVRERSEANNRSAALWVVLP